jgi:hypothetical protein
MRSGSASFLFAFRTTFVSGAGRVDPIERQNTAGWLVCVARLLWLCWERLGSGRGKVAFGFYFAPLVLLLLAATRPLLSRGTPRPKG